MGQAKQRGTFEQRKAQAIARDSAKAQEIAPAIVSLPGHSHHERFDPVKFVGVGQRQRCQTTAAALALIPAGI